MSRPSPITIKLSFYPTYSIISLITNAYIHGFISYGIRVLQMRNFVSSVMVFTLAKGDWGIVWDGRLNWSCDWALWECAFKAGLRIFSHFSPKRDGEEVVTWKSGTGDILAHNIPFYILIWKSIFMK